MKTTIKSATTLRTPILLSLIVLLAIPANLWPSQAQVEYKVRAAAATLVATQVQARPQQKSLELRAIQGFAGELTAAYRNADNSKVITNTVVEILQILLKKHVAQPTLTQQELVTDDAIQRCVELLKVDIKNTFLATKGVTLGAVTDATNIDKLRQEAEEEAEGAVKLLLRKSADYICMTYAEQIRQQSYNENAYLKLEATLVAKIREISDQYGCDQKKIEEAVACITKTLAEDQSVLVQMRELEQLAQFTGRGRPTIEDLYTKSTALLECCEKQGKKLCMPQDLRIPSRKRPLYKTLWDILEHFPAELVALVVGYVPAYFGSAVVKDTLDGHDGNIECFVFLPDCRGISLSGHSMKVWDLDTGECSKEIRANKRDWFNALVSVSPSQVIVGGHKECSYGFIQYFDLITEECLEEQCPGEVKSTIFVANHLIVVIDSSKLNYSMEIWKRDANTWRTVVKQKCGVCDRIHAVDKNRFIHSRSKDNSIMIWTYNIEAKDWCSNMVVINDVRCLAVLPHNAIASAGGFCFGEIIISIRDLNSGKFLCSLKGHSDEVNALIALPNNKLASAGDDNVIRMWDLATGVCEHVLTDHKDDLCPKFIYVLALSPDGQLLASGTWDGTVRFWDMETFTCVKVCRGSFGLEKRFLESQPWHPF